MFTAKLKALYYILIKNGVTCECQHLENQIQLHRFQLKQSIYAQAASRVKQANFRNNYTVGISFMLKNLNIRFQLKVRLLSTCLSKNRNAF